MNARQWTETLQFLNAFLPCSEWPPKMRHLVFGGVTILSAQRLTCVLFLYGNGVQERHIRTVLQPLLRDNKAVVHVQEVLSVAKSGKRDRTWFYFDVGQNDYLFLGGRPCDWQVLQAHSITVTDEMIVNRKVNAWSRYTCFRAGVRLSDQDAFFRDMDETNPRVFFADRV